MSDIIEFSIPIEPDEEGMVGRECLKCKMYFKVRFGTGLHIEYHICPYCDYKGPNNEFFTEDQIEYARSIAIKKAIGPTFEKFENDLKKLERTTKDGFIQIKFTKTGDFLRIKHYQEKTLETDVTCDNCGLVFSIYGVFSNCPDCGKLNAKVIFEKSIEASKKRLEFSAQDGVEGSLKEELMKDALLGAISSFDSLGKALRDKHSSKFPTSPKNLFQNLFELDNALKNCFGKNIKDYLSSGDTDFLLKMFQVRHIYEHNAGVIDDDFVRKIPNLTHLKGRKYSLIKEEISRLLDELRELTEKIYSEVE